MEKPDIVIVRKGEFGLAVYTYDMESRMQKLLIAEKINGKVILIDAASNRIKRWPAAGLQPRI